MNETLKNDFDKWLRVVCFKKPTKEAESLAWEAWKYKDNKSTEINSGCRSQCPRSIISNILLKLRQIR